MYVCCAARGEDFQSESVPGLFPCGEGAGYAGGIISAAGKYSPFHQMQALSMHNNLFKSTLPSDIERKFLQCAVDGLKVGEHIAREFNLGAYESRESSAFEVAV